MRFRNMMKWAAILSVLLLCTACGNAKETAEDTTAKTESKTTEISGVQKNYLRCEGTTAVVAQDSTLTECFTLQEDDSNETGKITQTDADDYKVAAGDTVLMLHEDSQNSDRVHVMVPNDDASPIYGYLAKENLSTEDITDNIDQSVKDTDTWNR